MRELRIVIAEDHPLFRDGLKSAIGRDAALKIVGEAEHGDDAYELIQSRRPDVAVLDVGLPGLDGCAIAHPQQAVDDVERLPEPARQRRALAIHDRHDAGRGLHQRARPPRRPLVVDDLREHGSAPRGQLIRDARPDKGRRGPEALELRGNCQRFGGRTITERHRREDNATRSTHDSAIR